MAKDGLNTYHPSGKSEEIGSFRKTAIVFPYYFLKQDTAL